MRFFPRTLWDLLVPAREAKAPRAPRVERTTATATAAAAAPSRKSSSIQIRYDELVRDMKKTHHVRVHRWRSGTSGCAWEAHGSDGSLSRLIEAPYPRGPMSCAIFLHEIGHHAIGFARYRPRCLEEYHAWRWALETMEARGFTVTASVLRRRDEALRYAVRKARRRGLARLPHELAPWQT